MFQGVINCLSNWNTSEKGFYIIRNIFIAMVSAVFSLETYLKVSVESFPPGRWVGNFIFLGNLKFSPAPGKAYPNGRFKIFHIFGVDKAFLTGRNGASPFPTGQKFIHPSSTRKSPPSGLTPKFVFPHQRFIPIFLLTIFFFRVVL